QSGPRDAQCRHLGRHGIRPGSRLRERPVGTRRRIARRDVRSHCGVLLGLDRLEHRGRGIPPLRSLVPSTELAGEQRALEREADLFRGFVRAPPPRSHVTASRITNAAKTTLITPFIVKNAVSSRRRSPGRTSECSYASRIAMATTPSQ